MDQQCPFHAVLDQMTQLIQDFDNDQGGSKTLLNRIHKLKPIFQPGMARDLANCVTFSFFFFSSWLPLARMVQAHC